MALFLGNPNANVINGAGTDDAILGFGGNDTLNGLGGADGIAGGAGADTVDGGSGNDGIDGGSGADTLLGGGGVDVIVGAEGDDVLRGGGGDDDLNGGGENDDLFGNSGNDELEGGDGADELFGGLNDDVLLGGEGDDVLDGGQGFDTLSGSDPGLFAGIGEQDVFDWDFVTDTAVGALRDVMLDFGDGAAAGEDLIDLSDIDADATVAGNQTFTFVTGAFTAAAQVRVIQNPADLTQNIIQLNTDNDTTAEGEILDAVGNNLAAVDFIL